MSEDHVGAEMLDDVALLTVRAGDRRNALSEALWQQLGEALERLAPRARAVVLTGGGTAAFATGGGEGGAAARDVLQALRQLDKPVLARLRGDCLGAGMALALAADLRVAAADSAFALNAEDALALGCVDDLADAVGPAAARFLLMTGMRIEAPEALRIGLVSRVLDDAGLSDGVSEMLRQAIDASAEAVAAVKQALRRDDD